MLSDFFTTDGLCNRNLTWNELHQIIAQDRLELLGRLKEGRTIYLNSSERIKQEWATVGDFILNREFNFPSENVSGKKRVTFPEEIPEIINFRVNDYRYAVEDSIEHHLIWSTVPLTEDKIKQILEKERVGYEYLFFVNPPNLQSVKNVHHVHVFSRKKIRDDICKEIRNNENEI
eukprot:TRINITY_DN967_c0_g1_i2.p1 TRINITY_DN967_c0_g1~~TRINITY_DN967_c0_g1_i2.p1  ORF type:complete len:175 (-),score=26.34 TRINITY_DN967_c0_g1_i2:176-700(-)